MIQRLLFVLKIMFVLVLAIPSCLGLPIYIVLWIITGEDYWLKLTDWYAGLVKFPSRQKEARGE